MGHSQALWPCSSSSPPSLALSGLHPCHTALAIVHAQCTSTSLSAIKRHLAKLLRPALGARRTCASSSGGCASSVGASPLLFSHTDAYVGVCTVLLGNAVHTMHPLTGQHLVTLAPFFSHSLTPGPLLLSPSPWRSPPHSSFSESCLHSRNNRSCPSFAASNLKLHVLVQALHPFPPIHSAHALPPPPTCKSRLQRAHSPRQSHNTYPLDASMWCQHAT
ncbi:hypothetical protein B0H21DRAFT_820657 [Amylocystis lapponica]|nr:hypothetical protein B0H21DRAFT_820657 [Amylocystis lapponica]